MVFARRVYVCLPVSLWGVRSRGAAQLRVGCDAHVEVMFLCNTTLRSNTVSESLEVEVSKHTRPWIYDRGLLDFRGCELRTELASAACAVLKEGRNMLDA